MGISKYVVNSVVKFYYIGEIIELVIDGCCYVFGLFFYNILQEDVMFVVGVDVFGFGGLIGNLVIGFVYYNE